MGFIDGKERDVELLQEFDGFLFREGFGGDIKQFGAPFHQVVLHLAGLHFGKGGVEEVCHTVASGCIPNSVDLVLH